MIGTLIAGLKAVRNAREAEQSIDRELRAELARRNRIVSEDPTRRADAARMLSELDTRLREHTRRARDTATVAGVATAGAAEAARQSTEALGRAVADITLAGEERRRQADKEYQQRRRKTLEQRRRLLGLNTAEVIKAGQQL
ncbi:MAG: hypothetical protein NC336_06590 [Clostridium sp.]|nr:hypothetical protein [Clostridium sp.]